MKLAASSALAPIVAGTPIAIVTALISDGYDDAETMLTIIVAGMPVAIVLSMLATFFLQSDDLFQAKYTLLYCSLSGACLAAVATLGFLDLSPLFWGVVAWGFLSGAIFRLLLGRAAT